MLLITDFLFGSNFFKNLIKIFSVSSRRGGFHVSDVCDRLQGSVGTESGEAECVGVGLEQSPLSQVAGARAGSSLIGQ